MYFFGGDATEVEGGGAVSEAMSIGVALSNDGLHWPSNPNSNPNPNPNPNPDPNPDPNPNRDPNPTLSRPPLGPRRGRARFGRGPRAKGGAALRRLAAGDPGRLRP